MPTGLRRAPSPSRDGFVRGGTGIPGGGRGPDRTFNSSFPVSAGGATGSVGVSPSMGRVYAQPISRPRVASGTGVRVAGDAELSAARGSLSELRLVDKHYRTDQPNAVVGRPTVRAGGGLPITKPKHEELGLIERWMRDVFGSDVEGWPDYGRLRRGTLAIDRMRRAEQGIQHRFSTALIDILLKDQEGDNSFALTSLKAERPHFFD